MELKVAQKSTGPIRVEENGKSFTGARIEDLAKTNERLRKEQEQSALQVMDLRDDYTSRLLSVQESYERER